MIKLTAKLLIILIVSILFFGCQSQKKDESYVEDSDTTKELIFVSGTGNSSYYPLGEIISSIWNNELKKENIIYRSGDLSGENLLLIENSNAQIAIALNPVAHDAWAGNEQFIKPLRNFRAVGAIFPEVLQFVLTENQEINNLTDLKGKRIALGSLGTATFSMSSKILESNLLNNDEIRSEYISFTDAANKIKNDLLDGAFGVLNVPSTQILDLMKTKEIKIYNFSDQELNDIIRKYPFISKYTLPREIYGNSKPIDTLSCKLVLYVSNDLETETVYNLTKIFYENIEEISKSHPSGSNISKENALIGVSTPLHKGAIQYFEEEGFDIPSELK